MFFTCSLAEEANMNESAEDGVAKTAELRHLKWRTPHSDVLCASLRHLYLKQDLTDVTLACNKANVQCHRVVLAACSPRLKSLLSSHPSNAHPVVILPPDVNEEDLKDLIGGFVYGGGVTVQAKRLPNILRAAEALGVEELMVDEEEDEKQPEVKKVSLTHP